MSRLTDLLTTKATEKGLTQSQIAERLGMSQQGVSAFFNGNNATMRKWRELADLLGIDHAAMGELMAESREELGRNTRLPRAVSESLRAEIPVRPNVRKGMPVNGMFSGKQIPVLGQAVGGADGEYIFNGTIIDWLNAPPQLDKVAGAYSIFVDGDSMYPAYEPGQAAYVHPSRPPRAGNDVVVQIYAGEDEPPHGFLKRFVRYTPTKMVCQQFNPAREIEFERDKIVSVHTIVFSDR